MKGLFIATSVLLIANAHAIGSLVGFDHTDVKPNSYIVVLKSDISNAALYSHRKRTDKILGLNENFQKSDFDVGGFRGYHLLAPKSIAEQLAESDEVAYIEADRILRLDAPEPPTPHKVVARVVQPNAPWGLARISHRKAGSTEYVFEENTGTYVYILDTGVRITHELFEGRASYGFNAVGGSDDDLNGHGTHIAGIASSKTYGVVRFANIISVKVLDDSGSTSTSVLITGINWAVQDIQNKSRVGNSTALLALGGSKSTALNQAVAAGSNQGLFFAVAAGQSNADASNYSPASEPTACTVGSTTMSDARKSSSNYGAVVDIYAPGDSIPSLGIANDTAITILSGTSMSAAYIAGLGAYFLALEGPRPAVGLCERLKEVATKNVLSGIPTGSWNLLAYNLSGL